MENLNWVETKNFKAFWDNDEMKLSIFRLFIVTYRNEFLNSIDSEDKIIKLKNNYDCYILTVDMIKMNFNEEEINSISFNFINSLEDSDLNCLIGKMELNFSLIYNFENNFSDAFLKVIFTRNNMYNFSDFTEMIFLSEKLSPLIPDPEINIEFFNFIENLNEDLKNLILNRIDFQEFVLNKANKETIELIFNNLTNINIENFEINQLENASSDFISYFFEKNPNLMKTMEYNEIKKYVKLPWLNEEITSIKGLSEYHRSVIDEIICQKREEFLNFLKSKADYEEIVFFMFESESSENFLQNSLKYSNNYINFCLSNSNFLDEICKDIKNLRDDVLINNLLLDKKLIECLSRLGIEFNFKESYNNYIMDENYEEFFNLVKKNENTFFSDVDFLKSFKSEIQRNPEKFILYFNNVEFKIMNKILDHLNQYLFLYLKHRASLNFLELFFKSKFYLEHKNKFKNFIKEFINYLSNTDKIEYLLLFKDDENLLNLCILNSLQNRNYSNVEKLSEFVSQENLRLIINYAETTNRIQELIFLRKIYLKFDNLNIISNLRTNGIPVQFEEILKNKLKKRGINWDDFNLEQKLDIIRSILEQDKKILTSES